MTIKEMNLKTIGVYICFGSCITKEQQETSDMKCRLENGRNTTLFETE